MDNPSIRPNIYPTPGPQAPIRPVKVNGETPDVKTPSSHGQGLKETEKTVEQKQVGPLERSIDSLLPLPILERPELQQSEWAWRRFVLQMFSAAVLQTPDGEQPNSGDAPYAPIMETLWNTIVDIAADDSSKEWHTLWNQQSITSPTFVPFSDLKAHHLNRLPEKIQNWVLADRLRSSVESSSSFTSGEGVFLLPTNEQNQTSQAVRWKAERQSKVALDGSLIHRLTITCEVNASAVELTITFAKPTLLVHAATDNTALRRDFEHRNESLMGTLRGLGFEVDRFSVGPLSEERDI